ncbi:MAG: helix-turn-helix transcriptional regulator [Clostridia bacterium]|nr:helix-turn-helix transcriptional regulator [Clostridia bacterium]
MTIGEKIKSLRLAQNVTQEKLAEYLNISYQSVSKWEKNNALPDITLVVPIANFFGVTTDELFDRNASAKAVIEGYDRRAHELKNRGERLETLALWREAVQKYPNDYHCLCELMAELACTVNMIGVDPGIWKKNAEEAVSIGERILRDCTDGKIREKVISELTYLHANPQSGVADEEKSVTYAKMAGCVWYSSEILLEQAYFTEEGAERGLRQQQENMLTFLETITRNMVRVDLAPKEQIFFLEGALKLWETVIYDGNYLFYHHTLSYLWNWMAQSYAELGDRENTLAALEKCLFHARAADEVPEGESHFTSTYVNLAVSDTRASTRNYTGAYKDAVKEGLRENWAFASLWDDPAFLALAERE